MGFVNLSRIADLLSDQHFIMKVQLMPIKSFIYFYFFIFNFFFLLPSMQIPFILKKILLMYSNMKSHTD